MAIDVRGLWLTGNHHCAQLIVFPVQACLVLLCFALLCFTNVDFTSWRRDTPPAKNCDSFYCDTYCSNLEWNPKYLQGCLKSEETFLRSRKNHFNIHTLSLEERERMPESLQPMQQFRALTSPSGHASVKLVFINPPSMEINNTIFPHLNNSFSFRQIRQTIFSYGLFHC